MRQRILMAAIVAAGLVLGHGAFAWEIQHTGGTNPDGTPRFTDPDTITDGMANHLSGGSGSTSSGSGVKIGNTSFSFGGGSNSSSGMTPALQERFFDSPNSHW